jgi:uncharacterized membrane protein YhaH (DUF805 family)
MSGIDWTYLFTNFEGRIARRDYWFGAAILLLLHLLSFFLFGYGLVGYIARLLIWIAGLAIVVKRLHDWGKTGWLALIGFIPFIGPIFMIVLGFVEGEHGPNRFGPDPKHPALPPTTV